MLEDKDFITGLDYAQRQNIETHAEFILWTSRRIFRAGGGGIAEMWNGKTKGEPVEARIDFERWLADCPDPICSGAEMVCLEDAIFFCMSCGNASNDFYGFKVKFPTQKNRLAIYDELDKRPQNRLPNQSRIVAVETARPVFPSLGRSWKPGETVEDLKEQRSIYPDAVKHKTKKIPSRPPAKSKIRNDSEKGGKM